MQVCSGRLPALLQAGVCPTNENLPHRLRIFLLGKLCLVGKTCHEVVQFAVWSFVHRFQKSRLVCVCEIQTRTRLDCACYRWICNTMPSGFPSKSKVRWVDSTELGVGHW